VSHFRELSNLIDLWNRPMQQPTTRDFARAAIYGLSAVCIWAAFIVVSRLGVRTSLTPWDVAAIRFAVAGAILSPYLMRRGLALDRLGWIGVAAVAVGCGAPMVLLVNAGLLFAPAAHGGALFPGVMPLMVAMLAAPILGEAFTPRKNVGLILIVVGAIGIVWVSGGTLGTRQNIGHLLFLCAGLAWAVTPLQCEGLDSQVCTLPPSRLSHRSYSMFRSTR
jgi:drug/metabolite transporter (DMT)-like permease